MRTKAQSYAGFMPRLLAFAQDYLILGGYLLLLLWIGVTLIGFFPGFSERISANPLLGQLLGFLSLSLPVGLYFAFSEASPRQATWGKRRMHLQVVDTAGTRLSLPRALLRSALKFIPWELAHTCIWQLNGAGYDPTPWIVAGFIVVWVIVEANAIAILVSKKHQALYDLVAGTLVVKQLCGCSTRSSRIYNPVYPVDPCKNFIQRSSSHARPSSPGPPAAFHPQRI